MPLKTSNPDTMPPPAALYSQVVEIPPNARWVFLAGQTAIASDGSVPEGFEAQSRQIWQNTVAGLASVGMTVDDIVRINVFATNASDIQHLTAIRAEFLNEHTPASTWLVVSQLAQPQWIVEQEVIAAKVD
jgi:enamine deaminase RidA (YjgF/YER057c/UK114 family)